MECKHGSKQVSITITKQMNGNQCKNSIKNTRFIRSRSKPQLSKQSLCFEAIIFLQCFFFPPENNLLFRQNSKTKINSNE